MIFPDLRAESMYFSADPYDECGSELGMGWGGLYLNMDHPGGHILEAQAGSVSRKQFDSDEILQETWRALCEALELSGDPDEQDCVIEHEGYGKWVVTPGSTQFFMFDHSVLWAAKEVEGVEDGSITLWLCNRRHVFTIIDEEYIDKVVRALA